MRLQTFLAHAGISSRRSSADIIESGAVAVNGKVVLEKWHPVEPGVDRVTLYGKAVSTVSKLYYVLNKPRGVTSTVKDSHAKSAVVDLLPRKLGRLYPVGRLDKDTTGIILLTNDGELTHRLTHPRFAVAKVYVAKVKGRVLENELKKLSEGVRLEDGLTAPCRARILSFAEDTTVCEIEIREGKKRQVRRMFDSLGHRVLDLKRTFFAGIGLGDLEEGEFRKLSASEVEALKEMTYRAA